MGKYKEIRRNPNEVVRPDYTDQFGVDDDPSIGWILVYGDDWEKEVKIGFSAKKNRYKGDDIFGNSRSHLLAAVRGTKQNEHDIHVYFDAYNVQKDGRREKTEFFYAKKEVCDYIAFLRAQYYVAITKEEMGLARCVQPISFDLWKPSAVHRKEERTEKDLVTQLEPWSFFPDRSISNMMDDWYTPKAILDCARIALGGVIDLDPASHVVANERVEAEKFYTEREGSDIGGLGLPWYGRVWLNPPFTKWKSFSQKIVKELDRGEISKMVVLANSRTITAHYFEDVLARATAVCILQGRYSFWGNEKDGSPSNGQVLLYFSPDLKDSYVFEVAFSAIGITFHCRKDAYR